MYIRLIYIFVCMRVKLLQSCLTLWPYILESTRLPWSMDSPGKNTGVTLPSSRESSSPRDRSCISSLAGGFFTASTAWYIYTYKTQHQVFFPNELALCIRWPKYWSFSISPSKEYSVLISFRIDWLDLLQSKGLSRVFPGTGKDWRQK